MTATAPTPLSNAVVTSTQSQSGYRQSMTVVAFSNAGGVGAAGGANGPSGAPQVSLATTRANSLVYGIGNDYDCPVPRVVGPGQTMVHQWVDTNTGDTYWVQAINHPVVMAGTATLLNDTSPTTDQELRVGGDPGEVRRGVRRESGQPPSRLRDGGRKNVGPRAGRRATRERGAAARV